MYVFYFKVRKPTLLYYCSNLVSKRLASCLKISTFLPYLHHSFPISSSWRVACKIAVSYKLIVFPSPCFAFSSLDVLGLYVIIRVLEKRAADNRRLTIGSPMLAIRRAPADLDTRASCSGPTLCNIVIGHLNHGWYIVAIPDPGGVYDLRAWHRCDQEQSW